MNQPKYQLRTDNFFTIYEFISEGIKVRIPKIIQFTETNYHDVFNLAFGDIEASTGLLNDTITSNNGDSDMVLATVVSAVYAFTEKYPNAWIFATGSTKARTILYRMGISKFLTEVKADFQLFGQINASWEPFEPDTDYEAFLVKRKN